MSQGKVYQEPHACLASVSVFVVTESCSVFTSILRWVSYISEFYSEHAGVPISPKSQS